MLEELAFFTEPLLGWKPMFNPSWVGRVPWSWRWSFADHGCAWTMAPAPYYVGYWSWIIIQQHEILGPEMFRPQSHSEENTQLKIKIIKNFQPLAGTDVFNYFICFFISFIMFFHQYYHCICSHQMDIHLFHYSPPARWGLLYRFYHSCSPPPSPPPPRPPPSPMKKWKLLVFDTSLASCNSLNNSPASVIKNQSLLSNKWHVAGSS